MNGLIIYKGKNGATRQYAEWLSQDADLLIRLPEKVTKEHLANAGFLLLVTAVQGGKMQLQDWLLEYENRIKNKQLFLFIVNAFSSEGNTVKDKCIRENVPEAIRKNCEIYFLPDRLVFSKSPQPMAALY